jgi:hypothetical protein
MFPLSFVSNKALTDEALLAKRLLCVIMMLNQNVRPEDRAKVAKFLCDRLDPALDALDALPRGDDNIIDVSKLTTSQLTFPWSRELLNELDAKLKDGVVAIGGITIDRAALVTEIASLFVRELEQIAPTAVMKICYERAQTVILIETEKK